MVIDPLASPNFANFDLRAAWSTSAAAARLRPRLARLGAGGLRFAEGYGLTGNRCALPTVKSA
jgi:hypothetical protein